MKKIEMIRMGMEFTANYYKKYNLPVEVQYKYRGEIKTRTEYHWTEEAKRIHAMLEEPMFICPCCKEVVSFNDLESWLGDSEEDFLNDKVSCSMCYEDYMGDDL
jgi:formylglycine-generating enzyme required for sulfatase activity